MASPRISANLPPAIDPTKAPIAFGRRALPKLNEEIQSPELLTQQRALMALCDLVHDPENVYQAIQIGFLENLKTLLLHHDSTVRQKTTEILYIMATHSVGREGLIQNEIIPVLAELLDDPVDICRKNTHQVFDMMARLPEGVIADRTCLKGPCIFSKGIFTIIDYIQTEDFRSLNPTTSHLFKYLYGLEEVLTSLPTPPQ